MPKLYSSKTCLKMDGGGDASPLPLDPFLPAPITMYLTTTSTSRFGFNIMWGKFCHSCFEITACTALAQFRHFTLKTRIRFQKGNFNPLPPLGAPLTVFSFVEMLKLAIAL